MALQFERSWTSYDLDLFRDSAGRFIDLEMAPQDEAARKRGDVGHDLWLKAGRLGMLCTDIPEEWGGGGGDFRHEAVFGEEMSRRGLTGMGSGVHSIAAHYILHHGTDEQKRRFLPRMTTGELVGAIAMSEPGAGSDLQALRTQALRRGNDYVLNGSKTFISNGVLAGVVLVVCKTDPAQRARGMSIMIVETRNCSGFRVGAVLDKIGLKAQDTAELFFDDVIVPQANLLGSVEGMGFSQLMTDLPYERLMIAVNALAATEGAYESTLVYTRDRKAFGKQIAEFQNTKFKLAQVATNLTAGRAFIDRCVERLVKGTLDTATASMAKLWATNMQCNAIDDLMQLYGGYGYMNEYLIGRMYVDARVQRIYGGTDEVMKEVISRAL